MHLDEIIKIFVWLNVLIVAYLAIVLDQMIDKAGLGYLSTISIFFVAYFLVHFWDNKNDI